MTANANESGFTNRLPLVDKARFVNAEAMPGNTTASIETSVHAIRAERVEFPLSIPAGIAYLRAQCTLLYWARRTNRDPRRYCRAAILVCGRRLNSARRSLRRR